MGPGPPRPPHPPPLTQQRRDASGDGVGYAEGQQQDADHWSSQAVHDQMEVHVPDAISINLQAEPV